MDKSERPLRLIWAIIADHYKAGKSLTRDEMLEIMILCKSSLPTQDWLGKIRDEELKH